MVIAFPTPEYVTNKEFGGLATYLYKTSKYLKELNHKPVIFLLTNSEGKFEYEGVEIVKIKRKKYWWFWLVNALTLFTVNSSLLILNNSWAIRSALEAYNRFNKISIIQYSNAQFLSIVRPVGIPHCLRLSQYYKEYSNYVNARPRSFKNRQKHLIERICIKQSKNSVYGPSSLIGKMVTDKLKIHVKLIRTPFFNISKNTSDKFVDTDNRTLLYFGTLSYSKGVDLFAQILPDILKEYPNINVRFVGRDTPLVIKDTSIMYKLFEILLFKTRSPLKAKMFSDLIREQTKEYSDRVSFSSVVKPKEMQSILNDSDVIILPSRIDNFPNTLSESLSAGKVVVVPSNSSLDELISNGKNGFVFKNGNSKDLVKKIKVALNLSESENKIIRQNASESVKVLYPDNVVKGDLLSFYHKITS